MSEVYIRKEGSAGHITLNRPKALNALTHNMALLIERALMQWIDDKGVKLVIIDAAGDRAFCAGGDIVDIYKEGVRGKHEHALQFWRDEYRLNALIANYPKPYIAFMDGIVMGGGVGISAHGSHRIVTHNTKLAMPECAIGIVPDVGGSLLLGSMPSHCGEYAGLTGARLNGPDCLYANVADVIVNTDQLYDLKTALQDRGEVSVINEFIEIPGESKLAQYQSQINTVFGLDTLEAIADALAESTTPFAESATKGLKAGSPLAQKVALKFIRHAREHKSIALALRDEYRFVSRSVLDGEFIEGIRATVIDKDRSPQWKYPTLASVTDSIAQSMQQVADGGDFTLH
jgi:enoyl-CoA hydratase